MLDFIKSFHLIKFGPKGAILDQEMYILICSPDCFRFFCMNIEYHYFLTRPVCFFFNSAQIQGKIDKIQPKISFFSITRFHVFFHKIKQRRLLDSHILIFFYRKFPI